MPTIIERINASKTEELFFLLLDASSQKIYKPKKKIKKRPMRGFIALIKFLIFETKSDTSISILN